MSASFESRVALVTGAGSGMGLATGNAFARKREPRWCSQTSTSMRFARQQKHWSLVAIGGLLSAAMSLTRLR